MTAGAACCARPRRDTDREPRRPVAARGRRAAQRRRHRGGGHAPRRVRCARAVGIAAGNRLRAVHGHNETDRGAPHRRRDPRRRARRVRERRRDARHRGSGRAPRARVRRGGLRGRGRARSERGCWPRSCCRACRRAGSASRDSCPARARARAERLACDRDLGRDRPCCSSRRTGSAATLADLLEACGPHRSVAVGA